MKYLFIILLIPAILLHCGNRNNKPIVDTSKNIGINNTNEIDLQSDVNSLLLSEFVVTSEDFEHILDILTTQYNESEQAQKNYHFYISIQNVVIKDVSGVKTIYFATDSADIENTLMAESLYISRSYYKDFVSDGYGFFLYKDYLFVLVGQQIENIFNKTNRTRSFPYKQEPIVNFDPPRWLYCYWNESFYLVYSAHCEG